MLLHRVSPSDIGAGAKSIDAVVKVLLYTQGALSNNERLHTKRVCPFLCFCGLIMNVCTRKESARFCGVFGRVPLPTLPNATIPEPRMPNPTIMHTAIYQVATK